MVPFGLQYYGIAPKCGFFWFVVKWIYIKRWFPLVCSNTDFHQNVVLFALYLYGFIAECGSLWFIVISNMWFPLVCSDMDLHQNVIPFGL